MENIKIKKVVIFGESLQNSKNELEQNLYKTFEKLIENDYLSFTLVNDNSFIGLCCKILCKLKNKYLSIKKINLTRKNTYISDEYKKLIDENDLVIFYRAKEGKSVQTISTGSITTTTYFVNLNAYNYAISTKKANIYLN